MALPFAVMAYFMPVPFIASKGRPQNGRPVEITTFIPAAVAFDIVFIFASEIRLWLLKRVPSRSKAISFMLVPFFLVEIYAFYVIV